MATFRVVPYERRIRQAELPGYSQNLRATPGAFGEGIADGINKVTDVAASIATTERKKADEAALFDLYNRASEARMAHEEALKQSKGVNAASAVNGVYGTPSVSAADLFAKDLDKIWQGVPAHLQAKATEIVAREHQGFQRSAKAWASEQTNQARHDAFASTLTLAAQRAAAGATTSIDEVQHGLRVGTDAIHAMASTDGWDKATLASRLLDFTSQAHGGVLDVLVKKDLTLAEEYLAKNRGQIEDGLAKKVDAVIQAKGIEKKGLELEAQIWGQFGGDAAQTAAAIQRLMADPDVDGAKVANGTDVAQVAMDALRKRVSARDAARRADDSERMGRLDTVIYRDSRLDRFSDDYMALSDEGRASVEAHYSAQQRENRREQSEYDEILRFKYRQLLPPQQRSVDIDTTPPFRGGSLHLREELKAEKQGLLNKSGMSYEESRSRAERTAQERKYSTKAPKRGEASDSQLYAAAIGMRFHDWSQMKENEGLKPSTEQWSIWDAEATHAVATSDNPIRRFVNKALGTNFEEVTTQPAFKARVRPINPDVKTDGRREPAPVQTQSQPDVKAPPTIKWVSYNNIDPLEARALGAAFERKHGRQPRPEEAEAIYNKTHRGVR